MALITAPLPAPENPTNVTQTALQSMQKKAIKHDAGVLDPANAMMFNGLPGNPQSAIFVVEAAPDTTAPVIARYLNDGMWPDAETGLPVYDGAVIEITGTDDVRNLRIISADGGAHKINIQYYSGI